MLAKLEENIRINNGKPFIFQHFRVFVPGAGIAVLGKNRPELLSNLASPVAGESLYKMPLFFSVSRKKNKNTNNYDG